MTEMDKEDFQPTPVGSMPRRERRSKLKYFSKMLKEHAKVKPSVDIKEENETKMREGILRMQRWATRYGILKRKVDELKGFKGGSTRSNQQESPESEPISAGES